MWRKEQAMILTETTGARLTDLDYAINAIHYDPSGCTDDDLEDLEKIKEMIELATRLAEKVAAHIEA